MATAIVMPKAGNSVEECILGTWRVKVGDVVKEGDVIADAETDKTEIEVEATAAGTVLALFWKEGDLVPVMQPMCAVGQPGEDPAALAPAGAAPMPAAAAAPAEAPAPPAAAPAEEAPAAQAAPAAAQAAPESAPAPSGAENAPMSPRAKRFVKEHLFVVPAIAGSGAQGRIMECDVEAAYRTAPRLSPAAAAMARDGAPLPASGTGVGGMVTAADLAGRPAAPAPAPAPAPAAPAPASPAAPVASAPVADVVVEKPLTHIRKIIAGRLQESLSTMAQYTLNTEAEVTGLLALRKRIKAQGEKLGLANINIGDMVMYAVIKALQKHPELNGEFSDNVVRLHSAVNIGFACDTPKGLVVPVLHGSQAMSLAAMCRAVKAMAQEANDGHLAPDKLVGATFTVSNLGSFGITTFTPVISAPQLAILGVGRTLLRPVRSESGEVVFKDFMQLSLTLNHMIVDGAPGARFLQTLKGVIENFELVCIAG